MPFLVVLIFWLTIIFASFSLFAQPNTIVIVSLLVFALSAAGAIYLILELGQPFTGLMQIPQCATAQRPRAAQSLSKAATGPSFT